MCVKPWPISQISSSWRRTLRWFRANPPGRSDAASRSLMTQQKARGSSPCAHLPFMTVPLTRLPSRRACASSTASEPLRRPGGRRARGRSRRHGRAPTPPSPGCASSRASGARTRGAPIASASTAPRNALRDVPTSTGTSTRATSSSSRARRSRLCADRLAEPDAGIGAQRVGGDAGVARDREPLDEEVADLGDDVVVAGLVLHRARLTLHVHRDVARHRASATTSSMSGSARPAETSLTTVAPASSAAAATAALRGVDADGHPGLGRRARLTTGSTRRSSSASVTGSAPGRVDSPPTSSTSAPVGDAARGRARPRRRRRGSGHRRRTSQG